jgi:hypothetical protein
MKKIVWNSLETILLSVCLLHVLICKKTNEAPAELKFYLIEFYFFQACDANIAEYLAYLWANIAGAYQAMCQYWASVSKACANNAEV